MAFYSNGNTYGLYLPYTHFRDTYVNVSETAWNRGQYCINLTGTAFNVYSVSTGSRIGGLYYKESFVVIGKAMVGNSGLYDRAYYVVFTGPDGYTPTLGLLDSANYTQSTPWANTQFYWNGEYWLKTYNRTINFYGHAMDPYTHIKSDGYSLGLTPGGYMTDAGNIYVSRAVAFNFPYYDCSGSEWCNAAATTRGTNCDVQGLW